ncbi:hypothetical protein [Neokomagataea thailandica]|uniref:hypothetical protein n=1 Tax=Neokomagataea TaxID=1223423 RepID=UPI0008342D6E|nr:MULTISPECIES: hypothetical protein [Neokomagataea]
MFLEQKTGSAPGLIYATIRHSATTRTFAIEVRKTDTGHFTALMPDKRWSIECHTEDAALMMHAATLFPTEHTHAPWLSTPYAPSRILTRAKDNNSAETHFTDEFTPA